MSSNNGTQICIIQANPDVTGVGIRVSIYLLALGGRILEFLISQISTQDDYKEFKDAVDSALGVQGLALLCTAIYQTVRHQLTLFHAICVIHLLALLGITVVSAGQYKGLGYGRLFTTLAITGIAGCAFVAFNAYVWATAPTFGSQIECNSQTVYVVFGVSIPATGNVFRWIIVATLSAIPASFLVVGICAGPCIAYCFWHKRRHPEGWTAYRYNNSPPEESTKTKQWVNLLLTVGFDIYAIVSLEETISRNHLDPSEKDWTFGQLLAIFMLLGVMNELLNLFLASIDREKEEEEENGNSSAGTGVAPSASGACP